MTPIAAYYVMVSTERDRADRKTRYQVPAPRRSKAARLASALESLVMLGRPSTVQPI